MRCLTVTVGVAILILISIIILVPFFIVKLGVGGIIFIIIIIFGPLIQIGMNGEIGDTEKWKAKNEFRRTLIQVIGGLIIITGIIVTYVEMQNLKTDQVSNRYSEAINQLGSKEIAPRIGGILALEQITHESKKHLKVVLDVLCSFVRNFEYRQNNDGIEKKEITLDIQTAMSVIGRIRTDTLGDFFHINLKGAKLKSCDLEGANLTGALLEAADLEGAILYGANLEWADLERTNLRGTDLEKANLCGANMKNADITGAMLIETILSWTGITLWEALHTRDTMITKKIKADEKSPIELSKEQLSTVKILREVVGLKQ